jgi:hypothetical protein
MGSEFSLPWDRLTCQQIINRLRDGLPPPAQVLGFLSVGYEGHLQRARIGLACAGDGRYDSTILIGRYGIGKTHLLRRVQVLAEAENYVAKYVEIGSGDIYFNHPEAVYGQILGNDSIYIDPGRGYYTEWKFVKQLAGLAREYKRRRARGLVILLDEMENTFNWSNLPQLPSRIKAYRFLDALFQGYVDKGEHGQQQLQGIYLMIAIAPGVIERAVNEQAGYLQKGKWFPNPAKEWINKKLPDRLDIEPLTISDAVELARRIRAIHSIAMNWNAGLHVGDDRLVSLCNQWVTYGYLRDERQLVKVIIEELETAEQHR